MAPLMFFFVAFYCHSFGERRQEIENSAINNGHYTGLAAGQGTHSTRTKILELKLTESQLRSSQGLHLSYHQFIVAQCMRGGG